MADEDFARRALLQGAIAMAVAPNVLAAAPATAPAPAPAQIPKLKSAQINSEFLAGPVNFQHATDWHSFKLRLMSDAESNALNSYFSDPLESRIVTAVKALLPSSIANYRYSRFLVEPLLADVAALLDRSAAYRRDAADFEVQAVRQAADYSLGQKLRNFDSQLALASNQAAEQNTFATSLGDAGSALSSSDPLQMGLKKWLSALQAQQTSLAQSATQIYNGQVSRLNAQEATADDMNTRSSQPGNSNNFAERSQRTESLLSQDLAEAYEKASCAALGIPLIYPASVANQVAGIPDIGHLAPDGQVAFLDSLIKWTRNTMRLLESRQQYETEVDMVLPLVQKPGWADSALVDLGTFNSAMALNGTGQLTPVVDQQKFFFGTPASPVRLRAIGLSFVGTMETDWDYLRGTALVTPPSQTLNSSVTGTSFQPKTVLVGSVPMFGSSSPPAYVSGYAVQNISPFGTWTIRFGKYLVGKRPPGGPEVDRTSLKDLVLHLRVVYEPG